MNQQIKTSVGVTIIIIIAVTVMFITWKWTEGVNGLFSQQPVKVKVMKTASNQEINTNKVEQNVIKSSGNQSRILLTPELISKSENINFCKEIFNSDEANKAVDYTNSAKGISMKIPYNEKWGNEKYGFNPYDELENGIDFGVTNVVDGCNLVRNGVTFLNAKTEKEEMAKLSLDPDVSEISRNNINGLRVIEYIEGGGFCGSRIFLVIGKKFNYEFSGFCNGGDSGYAKSMEDIIKSNEDYR